MLAWEDATLELALLPVEEAMLVAELALAVDEGPMLEGWATLEAELSFGILETLLEAMAALELALVPELWAKLGAVLA